MNDSDTPQLATEIEQLLIDLCNQVRLTASVTVGCSSERRFFALVCVADPQQRMKLNRSSGVMDYLARIELNAARLARQRFGVELMFLAWRGQPLDERFDFNPPLAPETWGSRAHALEDAQRRLREKIGRRRQTLEAADTVPMPQPIAQGPNSTH